MKDVDQYYLAVMADLHIWFPAMGGYLDEVKVKRGFRRDFERVTGLFDRSGDDELVSQAIAQCINGMKLSASFQKDKVTQRNVESFSDVALKAWAYFLGVVHYIRENDQAKDLSLNDLDFQMKKLHKVLEKVKFVGHNIRHKIKYHTLVLGGKSKKLLNKIHDEF